MKKVTCPKSLYHSQSSAECSITGQYGLWSRWPIPKRTMGAYLIVLLPPILNMHFRLQERREYFSVQKLIPQFPIE